MSYAFANCMLRERIIALGSNSTSIIFDGASNVHGKIGHPIIVGVLRILELFPIVQLWVLEVKITKLHKY